MKMDVVIYGSTDTGQQIYQTVREKNDDRVIALQQ